MSNYLTVYSYRPSCRRLCVCVWGGGWYVYMCVLYTQAYAHTCTHAYIYIYIYIYSRIASIQFCAFIVKSNKTLAQVIWNHEYNIWKIHHETNLWCWDDQCICLSYGLHSGVSVLIPLCPPVHLSSYVCVVAVSLDVYVSVRLCICVSW